jgi:hypothetical protein
LGLELSLNIFNVFLILGVSIPSVYMASKVTTAVLRRLSLLLSSFLLFHGIYHLTEALRAYTGSQLFDLLSDVIFEPLGWLLFLVFAVFYFKVWR